MKKLSMVVEVSDGYRGKDVLDAIQSLRCVKSAKLFMNEVNQPGLERRILDKVAEAIHAETESRIGITGSDALTTDFIESVADRLEKH